nr:RHS repeat domain-containing protein [Desulfomicrobium orale]
MHPDNSEEKSEYNAFGQPVRRVDPAGTVTAYAYDASGNLLKMTEAQGTNLERNSTFTYDARGNQLTATRGRAVTRMEYDEWDNPVRQVDAAGVETRFTYDALGRELTRTRAGAVWKREYGTDGRVANSTDPLGAVTRFFYDAGGNPVKTVDPTGNATEAGYDPAGRMMNATDALGEVTRFTYDSQGRPASRTDAAGQRMEYAYTPRGDLARTQDPAGVVSMTYDAPGKGCSSCGGSAAGRPVRVNYPTFSRLFAYDGLGRTVRETDVFGPKNETRGASYVYDRAGRLAEKRKWAHDPDLTHRVTKYAYDRLGRLVRETDNLGQATNYGYDTWDNLLALTDAKGQVTRFAHDAAGRTVSETRPLGGTTRYTYNATTGLLAEKLDARGVKTAYAYDQMGRVVGVDAYAGGRTEPGRRVRLAYDQMGRLVFHTDGQTAGAFTYDALGRKLTETVDYGSFNKTNTYAWQANGQPAAFTGPDGLARTYAYDTAGRLTAMSVGTGMVTLDDFTWTAPGTMTLPGGTRRCFGYDGLLRVTSINATSPADALIQNYSYTYDDAGNIRKKDTEHGAYAYSYDKLDRLIRSDNPVLTDEAFTYDQVGNRLSSADVSGGWLYNENNELLQAGNRAEYKYDAAGNLVEKKTPERTLLFEYDLDNHLSRVADGNNATVASYGYDFLRRRIWKDVRGVKTFYHYSDSGLVAEMDSNGNTLKSYGYRPGSPWGTDLLFMRENGKNYWYLNDHLGTPQQIVAENGGVVWKAQYQVFGKAEISNDSTVTNNLRFPGQYYDEETGMHYNWNRYYDPESGRYSQTDPIGLLGGLHLYTYVTNKPSSRIDPQGLEFGDFHYYRNWGGPGWTGRRWTSWNKMTEEEQKFWKTVYDKGFREPTFDEKKRGYPTDLQDYAYMRHDICYGEARMRHADCPQTVLRKALNQCDTDLINDLLKLGFSGHDISFKLHKVGSLVAFPAQKSWRNNQDEWEYYYEHGERIPGHEGARGLGLTFRF